MESGNITTTLKNAYDKIIGSETFSNIQNSKSIDIVNKNSSIIKKINNNKKLVITLIPLLIIFILYFVFIFRRIPRYLKQLNIYSQF